MYLSRLTLNPHARRVQRELANPYELHRTLMSAFPATLPEGERVLFRVDVDARTGVPTVLLQAHGQPDWAWLGDPRASGYLLRPPESKPFALAFTPGQTLAFSLRANPTVKVWLPKDDKDPEGAKKPVRLAVITKRALQVWFDADLDEANLSDLREKALQLWLERKGESGGFDVLRVTAITEGNIAAWQTRKDDDKRKLTHFAVRFEGLLQVTDPATLWETVQQGIGPGKGLGFGLLSLARG
jgi:CRISPR system Cascade subunit CasE